MKVASPTATRPHQRLGMCPLPPVVTCCRHVRRHCTKFLYVVQHFQSVPCTAYSCQVMAARQARDAERTRLSKDAVVDRGLAIADAEGLDALTIRRLGGDLGVTPMALYWHFRSKEAL